MDYCPHCGGNNIFLSHNPSDYGFYPCRYCKDGLVTKEISEKHQREYKERLKDYSSKGKTPG